MSAAASQLGETAVVTADGLALRTEAARPTTPDSSKTPPDLPGPATRARFHRVVSRTDSTHARFTRQAPLSLPLLVGIALLLLGARVVTTGRFTYAFLVRNLALALAPLPVGGLAVTALRRRTTAGLALGAGLAAAWLALFPNAPYLVTDFVHLHRRGEWSLLDVAMMTSFAAVGWLAAVRSLVAWRNCLSQWTGGCASRRSRPWRGSRVWGST